MSQNVKLLLANVLLCQILTPTEGVVGRERMATVFPQENF